MFLIIKILCLLLGTTSAQTWIAGTPVLRVQNRGGRALQRASNLCTAANRFRSFCDNDSNCDSKNAFICTGVGKSVNVCSFFKIHDLKNTLSSFSIKQISCGSGYCVSVEGEAECTDNTPDGCEASTADFECTSEGFFPDPFNCHTFYQCLADYSGSISSYPFRCNHPYVFDPSGPNNRFCRLTNGNAVYCSTIKCSASKSFENILMNFRWFPASSGQ